MHVRLAVVALVANALYRVGSEYLTYIKFRDVIRNDAMLKAGSDEELNHRIMDLSEAFEFPLEEGAVTIDRSDRHVVVQGSYQKPIEIVDSGAEPDAGKGPAAPELIRFKVRASLNGLPTDDDKAKGKKGAKS